MITVEHLTKYYGEHLAVDDLSFEISGGHVYGFLGPNGAGKSTTMNIITGCLSATEGTVKIDGHDIFDEPKEAKRLVGYLPEQPPLYMNESAEDYLRFVGRAKGLRGEELREQIEQVIEQTGIDHVRNRRIATLSKGYKQRVGIAQALLGNPSVIILDEPTVGLDPLQIIEIRDLIKGLGKERTVIFSSHILSEVRAICDEILMISKGKLVAFDTPDNLERQYLNTGEVVLTAQATENEIAILLSNKENIAIEEMSASEDGYVTVHVSLNEGGDLYALSGELFHVFADANVTLVEMTLKKANLEDIFLDLAEDSEQEFDEDSDDDEEEAIEGAGDEETEEENE